MIYTLLTISFLLDLFLLSSIGTSSLLFPLCSLISTIIIYPFFKKHEFNKFLIISLIIGGIYDVVYTNTILLNIGIFLLCALIIKIVFNSFSYNLMNVIWVSLLIIIFYRALNYFAFVLADYINFSLYSLLRGIYSSIAINLLYIIIFYYLSLFFSNKYKIERFS